jgi:hypothetical protein
MHLPHLQLPFHLAVIAAMRRQKADSRFAFQLDSD